MVPQESAADALRIDSDVQLQENADVINVDPRVTIEPDGGFLVADPNEAQIRVYSPRGRLRRYFGRRGRGPGEFDRLTAAARLPSGRIVAADMDGTLTVFDSAGAHVLATAETRLVPLYNIAVLDENRIAITGRLAGVQRSRLVHVWDFSVGRIVSSFFYSPPPRPGFESAFSFTGTADLAVHGDTVATIFALADTVYLFGLNGEPRGKIPLNSRGFRKLRDPMPRRVKLRGLNRWLESFSAAARIKWSPDGAFYVGYFDMVDREVRWRLVRLSPNGAGSFELRESPELLSISRLDTTLVLEKPGVSNVFSIARPRQ
jgi:hypothetical protein